MGRTFFRRANLIDGINPPRKNSVVVVDDERITNVSAEADAPAPSANDLIFDLDGRSLMPGMIQCHYHVAYDNVGNLAHCVAKASSTCPTLTPNICRSKRVSPIRSKWRMASCHLIWCV